MADSTFLFLEAAPVSERFRVAEAGSGWVVALACLAEARLLAPEADFRELADESRALVVVSRSPVDDFLAAVAGSPWQAVDSREPEVDSLARVGEPEVEPLVPAADFRARVAALADSAVVHSHAPEAEFRGPAAPSGSLELAHSRGPVADYRAPLVSRVALRLAYSAAL